MLSRFINQLVQASGLPMTIRQFWWYSFLYWSFLTFIWCCQATVFWLITPGMPMYYTEMISWVVELLLCWAATPLIIYSAQQLPLLQASWITYLLRQLVFHLLTAALFCLTVLTLKFLLLNALINLEQGQRSVWERVLTGFSMSFGGGFGRYMLVVLCYNVLVYLHRFQSLKTQHLHTELNNEQLQSQLANAQLQSLEMQLNPHFLFNTLHTVVSLMLRSQGRQATKIITALSDLLRNVLARSQANFIALRDEITLTKQYLTIEQIRFEDRLTVEFIIDPLVQECPVPQLILQPLVENAISHGIADATQGAHICVRAKQQAETVIIEVFANGTGQRQYQSQVELSLPNTLLRLQQAYGAKASLQIDQPEGGTITFRLMIWATSTKVVDAVQYVKRPASSSFTLMLLIDYLICLA